MSLTLAVVKALCSLSLVNPQVELRKPNESEKRENRARRVKTLSAKLEERRLT